MLCVVYPVGCVVRVVVLVSCPLVCGCLVGSRCVWVLVSGLGVLGLSDAGGQVVLAMAHSVAVAVSILGVLVGAGMGFAAVMRGLVRLWETWSGCG